MFLGLGIRWVFHLDLAIRFGHFLYLAFMSATCLLFDVMLAIDDFLFFPSV